MKTETIEDFMNKKDKFILDENNNVVTANLLEWGTFLNNRDRVIVKKEIIDGKEISTVFIGIDHNWMRREIPCKPHIFETMVFDKGYSDIYCDRYSTWKEAEEGHEKAVQWVKRGCKNENVD